MVCSEFAPSHQPIDSSWDLEVFLGTCAWRAPDKLNWLLRLRSEADLVWESRVDRNSRSFKLKSSDRKIHPQISSEAGEGLNVWHSGRYALVRQLDQGCDRGLAILLPQLRRALLDGTSLGKDVNYLHQRPSRLRSATKIKVRVP